MDVENAESSSEMPFGHADEVEAPRNPLFSANLGESRALLVLGKGGVGKTTIARALNDGLRERGFSARRLELGLGASIAPDPGAIVLDPHEAFERAAEPIFGSRLLVRAAFGHSAIQELLTVIPGLREYALLVAALGLGGPRNARERTVIDMPATGHGLSWLTAGRRLAAVAGRGRAADQALALESALRARREVGLVVVTQSEPVILSETRELTDALLHALGRGPDLLVINRVPPPLATPSELRALAETARTTSDPTEREALEELLAWCTARERTRQASNSLRTGGERLSLEDQANHQDAARALFARHLQAAA
jgi:hypothetical protein